MEKCMGKGVNWHDRHLVNETKATNIEEISSFWFYPFYWGDIKVDPLRVVAETTDR